MLRTNILISVPLLALGTTAFAGNIAEPIIPPAVPAPVAVQVSPPSEEWTGFYAGVQTSGGSGSEGLEGADYGGFGVHAGYLHDFGSLVMGGEFAFTSGTVEDGLELNLDIIHLKAIAGYDLGTFMPYATAGVSEFTFDGLPSDTVGFYGLGVTYAINDSFRVGAEYLNHETDNFANLAAIGLDNMSLKASFSF